MPLLLTSSDLQSQAVWASEFQHNTVFLDRPYDVVLGNGEAWIAQDGAERHLGPSDIVVVLLFRAPWEPAHADDPFRSLESFLLLEEALDFAGCAVRPGLRDWRAAYSKAALLRNDLFARVHAPNTILVDGQAGIAGAQVPSEYIVKCGYGVHRSVGDLRPRPSVIAAGTGFSPNASYRYVLQDYVEPVAECRVYSAKQGQSWKSAVFAMPCGARDCPDWRFTTQDRDLQVVADSHSELAEINEALAEDLRLWYLCSDFILDASGAPHLVDLNPHGSWRWLPEQAAARVDDLVKESLLSFDDLASKP
ncbi:MAG TPA: hypothetical protein VEA60_14515 [Allosphingosinicella sp.]|nr:hypothetical protein [Allosphingosinicella sp.]